MPYKNDSVSDLSENESRFRRLADSGIIGVFEGNEIGAIMDGNDAFPHMLGYTPEELETGARLRPSSNGSRLRALVGLAALPSRSKRGSAWHSPCRNSD